MNSDELGWTRMVSDGLMIDALEALESKRVSMPRSSDSHDLGHAERTPCPTQVLHLQVDNVTVTVVKPLLSLPWETS